MAEVKIDIPLHVLEDLEEIRQSSKYNMMDGPGVLMEMNNNPKMAKSLLWLVKIRGDRITLDHNKYVQALIELGNLRKLADDLTE